MIERIIVSGEEKEKHFQHNDRLAKEWETFAQENNGKISGEVNGFMLEFQLEFQHKMLDVKVEGSRRIANKNAGGHTGFLMHNESKVVLSPFQLSNQDWTISKKTKVKYLLKRMFGKTKELSFNPNYMVTSKEILKDDELIKKQLFNNLEEIAEIWKISNINNKVEVEYMNFIGINSLFKILELIS